MSANLVIRLRPASRRITGLVLKSLLAALQSAENPSQNYHHVLTVRFMPFETKLLKDLFRHLLENGYPEELMEEAKSFGRADYLAIHLFYRWSWANGVLRGILCEMNPEVIQDEHDGNVEETFEMFKTLLRTRDHEGIFDRRYHRTERFLSDNQDFINNLQNINIEEITIVPHRDDMVLWRLVAILFRENFDEMQNWKGFRAVAEIMNGKDDGDTDDEKELPKGEKEGSGADSDGNEDGLADPSDSHANDTTFSRREDDQELLGTFPSIFLSKRSHGGRLGDRRFRPP
jgi:hypothetical protein